MIDTVSHLSHQQRDEKLHAPLCLSQHCLIVDGLHLMKAPGRPEYVITSNEETYPIIITNERKKGIMIRINPPTGI